MKKLTVGQKVYWRSKPYDGGMAFVSYGFILSFRESTFGAKVKDVGARIQVESRQYFEAYGNVHTVIRCKNLYTNEEYVPMKKKSPKSQGIKD